MLSLNCLLGDVLVVKLEPGCQELLCGLDLTSERLIDLLVSGQGLWLRFHTEFDSLRFLVIFSELLESRLQTDLTLCLTHGIPLGLRPLWSQLLLLLKHTQRFRLILVAGSFHLLSIFLFLAGT